MKCFKKNGRATKAFINLGAVLKAAVAKEIGGYCRVYPKHWDGTPRHLHLNDTTYWHLIDMCAEFGLPYAEGNSSPRGGAVGYFMEFEVCTIKYILSILDSRS